MEVPNVKRKDYQLIGMDDDFLSMMDDTGDTREDLKCPEDDVGQEIKNAIDNETDILVSVGSIIPSVILIKYVILGDCSGCLWWGMRHRDQS